MRIVSLSPFHMVNIGRQMLVNPRRRFTAGSAFERARLCDTQGSVITYFVDAKAGQGYLGGGLKRPHRTTHLAEVTPCARKTPAC
jgi:hypothetical protein